MTMWYKGRGMSGDFLVQIQEYSLKEFFDILGNFLSIFDCLI